MPNSPNKFEATRVARKKLINKLNNFISSLCGFINQYKNDTVPITEETFNRIKSFLEEYNKDFKTELNLLSIIIKIEPKKVIVKNSRWELIITLTLKLLEFIFFNQGKETIRVSIPSDIEPHELLDHFWYEVVNQINTKSSKFLSFDKDNDQIKFHTTEPEELIIIKYDRENKQIDISIQSEDYPDMGDEPESEEPDLDGFPSP